jgi:hypothetical protein
MIDRSLKVLECASRSNEPRGKIVTVQPFEGGYELTKLSPRENGLVVTRKRRPQWVHQILEHHLHRDVAVSLLVFTAMEIWTKASHFQSSNHRLSRVSVAT